MKKNKGKESVINEINQRITNERDSELARLLGNNKIEKNNSVQKGFWYPGSGTYIPSKIIAGKA